MWARYDARLPMMLPASSLLLPLYTSAPHACSYLPGREARSQVVALHTPVSSSLHAQLLAHGFRRSGQFVYRPWCNDCRACVPVRVAVAHFVPSRTQRRISTRNAHLTLREVSRAPSDEQYALFLRYQRTRHPGGGMDQDSPQQYARFILETHTDSRLLEARDADGALCLVMLVDVADSGLSAVYTFFDPERPKDSLGTWGILRQIALCQQLGLPYLYLGYWIANSAKMAYKNRFSALQYFYASRWHDIPPPCLTT